MTIDEVVEKETDTEWVIRAKATWTANDENNTIMHRWGGAADKKTDKHGYAKAWGKAQRNAFKGFLRGHPEMKKAINEFMESESKQGNIKQPSPKDIQALRTAPKQEAPPQQNQTTTPRIRASQALSRNKDKLEKEHNIPAKTLADATVHHYSVDDLDSLPDSAWKEVEVYLNTSDFGIFEEWISAMRADDHNHPKGE